MTPTSGDPPRRTRVTSPRAAAGRPRRVDVSSEIDAQTRLGEVYMASLLRAQLRLALRVVGTVVATVGGLPVWFWLFPGLGAVTVLGMPLAWILLAVVVYPFLVLLAVTYVRLAERNERDFADVVERS